MVGRKVHIRMEEMQRGLAVLKSAIDRESSIIQFVPVRIFPQVYNRLHGQPHLPVSLAEALESTAEFFSRPWLRLVTPQAQSQSLVRTYRGHSAGVYYCSFSPDGRMIASSDLEGVVKIWSATNSEIIATLETHTWRSPTLFSLDNDHLLTVDAEKNFVLRNWQTGALVRRWAGSAQDVTTIILSPNGCVLLSAGFDPTIRLYRISGDFSNPSSYQEPWRLLGGHEKTVTSAGFSSDGQRIVSGSEDGTTIVWETETGRRLTSFRHDDCRLTCCRFHPLDRYFLTVSSEGTLRTFDSADFRPKGTLKNPDENTFCGTFSPDGLYFIAGGLRRLTIWETGNWTVVKSLRGHGGPIYACAFSPDGQWIASASEDGMIGLWNVQDALQIGSQQAEGHVLTIFDCGFSQDGKEIATASMDGSIKLWDGIDGRELLTLARLDSSGYPVWLKCVAFSPDGEWVAAGGESIDDYPIRIWRRATGVVQACLEGHSGPVNACAFSPDGQILATASDDATVKIWLANSGKEISSLSGHGGPVRDCAFSPDGRTLLSCSFDRTMRSWFIVHSSGQNPWTFHDNGELMRNDNPLLACSFCPDGTKIIYSDDTGRIGIINAQSGEMIRSAQIHQNACQACCFSADGRMVTSGVWADDVLRLSDSGTLKMIAAVTGLTGGVTACAFSPDGQRIVAGGAMGQLMMFCIENIKPSSVYRTEERTIPVWRLFCPFCNHPNLLPKTEKPEELDCLRCGCRISGGGDDRQYQALMKERLSEGLTTISIPGNLRIPVACFRLLPASVAKKYTVIPLLFDQDGLYLATAEPLSDFATDEIVFATGCWPLRTVLVSADLIQQMLKRHLVP